MPENSGETVRQPKTEHLAPHQFKPGQSGNPGGRPKGHKLTRAIARVLSSVDPKSGIKLRDLLARAFVANAIKGKSRYAVEIINRLDGPTPREIKAHVSGHLTAAVKVIEPSPEYMAKVLQILEQCEPPESPAGPEDARQPEVEPA